MNAIQDIFPQLGTPRRIAITMHQKPDPDALGSSLGLYHFLVALGHQVTVISPTNWPVWLNWMSDADQVIDYELAADKAKGRIAESEWLVLLDFNCLPVRIICRLPV